MRLLLVAATLAGCAAPGGEAPQPADAAAYTARGHQPAWSLTVAAGRITVVTDEGKQRFAIPLPAKQVLAGGGYRYDARTEAHALRVQVVGRVCRDPLTGVPYPDIVAVIVDGQRPLAGCGGTPESLLHGEWLVEDIDGAGLVEHSRVTLDFRPDGRLSGRASCNAYTTHYTVTGAGLRLNANIAATRMACPEALMRQEKAFLGILQTVAAYDIRPDGALALTGAGGRIVLARRK